MTINNDSKIELLTPNELAHILKISKRGVYRLIGKRRIRFYKVMRGIRLKKDDVIAFLEENKIDVIN